MKFINRTLLVSLSLLCLTGCNSNDDICCAVMISHETLEVNVYNEDMSETLYNVHYGNYHDSISLTRETNYILEAFINDNEFNSNSNYTLTSSNLTTECVSDVEIELNDYDGKSVTNHVFYILKGLDSSG